MMSHNVNIVDLDLLLLEEKQRVLNELIAQFNTLGNAEVITKAQALLASLADKNYLKEVDLSKELRSALIKAHQTKPGWFSWISDSSPALREAGYLGLRAITEFWSLNNVDDDNEALDCTSVCRISAHLFVATHLPVTLKQDALRELMGAHNGEAYVSVGDDLYYLNKVPTDFAVYANAPRVQVTRLQLQNPADLPRLKAILGISSPQTLLAGKQSAQVGEDSLRQIQMLYIKRLTGHDTHNQYLLSNGRQRDMDYFCRRLRTEPSDPETREMYSERERNEINEQARLRYSLLIGSDLLYKPVLVDGAVSAPNQRQVGNEASSSSGSSSFWGGVMMTVGLCVYCAGLIAINIFTAGVFAFAALAAVLVGIGMLLGGLALIGSEESSIDLDFPAPGGGAGAGMGRPRVIGNPELVALRIFLQEIQRQGAHLQAQHYGAHPMLLNFNLGANQQPQPQQQGQPGQHVGMQPGF